MKILIIGVDSDTVADLMATLNGSGYQIIKVNNGHEALKMIRSSNKRYEPMDLIVTAEKLADMNGLELIRTGKELIPELGIILITDSSDFDLLNELERMSYCRYVDKDCMHKDLIQTIQEIRWRLENPYYEVGF